MRGIRSNPELRHVLAHLYYAIEALAKNNRGEAMYELRSIEGLIFSETDEEFSAMANSVMEDSDGLQETQEELQRPEELQEPVRNPTR